MERPVPETEEKTPAESGVEPTTDSKETVVDSALDAAPGLDPPVPQKPFPSADVDYAKGVRWLIKWDDLAKWENLPIRISNRFEEAFRSESTGFQDFSFCGVKYQVSLDDLHHDGGKFVVKREEQVNYITRWLWYFEETPDRFVEYEKNSSVLVDSKILENLYKSCPSEGRRVSVNGKERNLYMTPLSPAPMFYELNGSKPRRVRRRPEAVISLVGIKQPLSYGCSYALIAEDDECFIWIKSDLEITPYKDYLLQVFRVYNEEALQHYEIKRAAMINRLGENFLNEKLLYHGTNWASAKQIMQTNFDFRLGGNVNGKRLGQGTYFSPSIVGSLSYAEGYEWNANNACVYLFYADVLMGSSAIGSSKFQRPPAKPNSDELYDSCVDKLPNFTRVVIFDHAQMYPSFLIKLSPCE